MEIHPEFRVMITGTNTSNQNSDANWNMLYHSIGSLVGEWVHDASSRIPLWHGQEEEIIKDILQETMMDTFKYISNIFDSSSEDENHFYGESLKNICKFIAVRCYRHLFFQDSCFVHTKSSKYPYQGYIIMREKFDPENFDQLEIDIDNTFQEWCCDHLAKEIVEIPPDQRKELLIYLANHKRFDTQVSHLLQKAFLRRGIQLQDYQQLLPDIPVVKQTKSPKRTMRKPKKLNQTDHVTSTQIHKKSKKRRIETLIEKAETIVLAAELDTTAPYAMIDPAFRQNLQNRLLDIQMTYYDATISVAPAFRNTLRDKLVGLLPPCEDPEKTHPTLNEAPYSTSMTEATCDSEKENDDQVLVSTSDNIDIETITSDDARYWFLLPMISILRLLRVMMLG